MGKNSDDVYAEGGNAFRMTLRDYFAIHADQPGAAEIATAAGLTYSVGAVWSDEDTRVASFDDWWRGLDQKRRFALSAQVRYEYADAMLAARDLPS